MAVVIDTRANGTAAEPKRRGNRNRNNIRGLDLIIAIEGRTGKTLRESVMAALRETGNEAAAARRLGTTSVTLRRWMAALGIKAKFRVEFVTE